MPSASCQCLKSLEETFHIYVYHASPGNTPAGELVHYYYTYLMVVKPRLSENGTLVGKTFPSTLSIVVGC